MKITTTFCDICRKLITENNDHGYYDVTFFKPSFAIVEELSLNLCEDCYNKIAPRMKSIIEEERNNIND